MSAEYSSQHCFFGGYKQIMYVVIFLCTLMYMLTRAYAVLPSYLPAATGGQLSRDELIQSYFQLGYAYKDIIAALFIQHGIRLSYRHLKRLLKKMCLRRKRPESDMQSIITAMLDEMAGCGQCFGHRRMWRRLMRTHHLHVKRKTVLELMWILDSEGVQRRKAHRLLRRRYVAAGPNYIWHMDGYDKLKPFGFAIHGAIDGYSRRILWLEIGSTNNNPSVICQYYLDCIEQVGCAPRVLRCDLGTENSTVKNLQPFFRRNDHDNFAGVNSFLQGKSTSNQRIEAWWSLLRRGHVDFWIAYFKDLRDQGILEDHNPIHIECLRLCFHDLLQAELHHTAIEWNTHNIQGNHHSESPTRCYVFYATALPDAKLWNTHRH